MTATIRKIRHGMYLFMLRVMSRFLPGSTHIAFVGSGSSRQLGQHIAALAPRKVLIVTDKALRELGITDKAVVGLLDAGVDCAWFDGVLPDPTFEQIEAGLAVQKSENCDMILAVGGGSVMDCAKIIAACATSDESPRDWVGLGKVNHELLPIYAIPTTAGTGSEGTAGAVVKDAATKAKSVMSGNGMLPKATALDASLMLGLPPHITAATGIDALTHAIEAYIGVWERGSRLEDGRIGVKLVFEHLVNAYSDGSNLKAREGMAMAAYYAGMAINQVFVGSVHAIAHQIGGRYGIPHGLANALILPHVLEYCREEAQPRLAELAVVIGAGEQGEPEAQLAHKFIAAVRELRTQVGIPDRSDLIRREDHEALTAAAVAECMDYPVPRLLDEASTLAILNQITD
ncbi:MAG: iron-containing alcohol dehydrogenase [Halieaceae bacterium]|jgi:alcohol dehydrogenase|nr:iron-containing alcohol dehydrogenase [Halieaceae bacterium]MBT5008326.1 iron-containing alcohol dehydrogenase [Halieaceae bacterium]MBT6125027.1 iron-containing alcohol dehydrogenase [Halieaceae bacterium]MBT7719510.1 iron-containing alcohol dehydrogenase [Halieaceae bacterium]